MEKGNNFSRSDSTLMGNTNINYEVTATGNIEGDLAFISGTKQVVSFNFNKETQQIEVLFRQSTNMTFPNGKESSDKVWKEIYGVKENQLLLIEVIDGKHTPAYYVDEVIEFEQKEKAEN